MDYCLVNHNLCRLVGQFEKVKPPVTALVVGVAAAINASLHHFGADLHRAVADDVDLSLTDDVDGDFAVAADVDVAGTADIDFAGTANVHLALTLDVDRSATCYFHLHDLWRRSNGICFGLKIGRASLGKECTSWCRSRWSPYH